MDEVSKGMPAVSDIGRGGVWRGDICKGLGGRNRGDRVVGQRVKCVCVCVCVSAIKEMFVLSGYICVCVSAVKEMFVLSRAERLIAFAI